MSYSKPAQLPKAARQSTKKRFDDRHANGMQNLSPGELTRIPASRRSWQPPLDRFLAHAHLRPEPWAAATRPTAQGILARLAPFMGGETGPSSFGNRHLDEV